MWDGKKDFSDGLVGCNELMGIVYLFNGKDGVYDGMDGLIGK